MTMGEYATYKGESVKIGTCENMYYLRADQRHLVLTEYPLQLDTIRFRFPFPDEDSVEPGDFDQYNHGISLYGVDIPAEVDHYPVQFIAQVGYNVMLPCPLSQDGKDSGLKMMANGFPGPVKIVQQAYRGGLLVTCCECGACGAVYRLPTLADAEPLILACRGRADREKDSPLAAQWWYRIADRIEAGYTAVDVAP